MIKDEKLTFVIPVYNEEDNIKIIYNEINKLNLKIEYNFFFIDDGSTDNSLNIIQELNEIDKRVNCISFSRNFGHQTAIYAGIENSKSDYVITMDCDLQHPTALIPNILKQKNNFDVIQMKKKSHGERNFIFRIFSNIFYLLINKISNL
jgi:dolichol-phosphate mannosyltransferase